MNFTCNLSVKNPTRKTKNNREYLVLPTVAVQEQVLNGEFLSADQIEASKILWNSVPVTWSHPEQSGGPGTIRQAEHHDWAVGNFLNVDMQGDKLRGEIWLDVELVKNREGGEQLLEDLESGEMEEVSTGYFAETVENEGTYNGEQYNAEQKNIIPDHLALLPNATGACSIEDGCGAGRVSCDEEDELKNNEGANMEDELKFDEKSFLEHIREFFNRGTIDNEDEEVSNEMSEEEKGDCGEETTNCEESVAEKYDLCENELEEVIELGLEQKEQQRQQREELIDQLAEKDDCKLNKDDLEHLESDQLECLHESFEAQEQEKQDDDVQNEQDEDVDYGARNLNQPKQNEDGVPEMPSVREED